MAIKSMSTAGNAVSQLPVSQVRTLREGFQILDRDSDGVVNRDDVADMLTQLGKKIIQLLHLQLSNQPLLTHD